MTADEKKENDLRELQLQVRSIVIEALDRDPPDFEALKSWRDLGPDHRAALHRELQYWRLLGPAATNAARQRDALNEVTSLSSNRRHMLRAGVFASAAAAAAVFLFRPPLGMWSSFGELSADIHTGTGERRTISRPSGVVVEANTRTSLNFAATRDGTDAFELVAGEAAFDMAAGLTRIVTVRAGTTLTQASGAEFSVRLQGLRTRVICLRGAVTVNSGRATVAVPPQAQVISASGSVPKLTPVNGENSIAWRRGFLIFENTPLRGVVEEVNRYRNGRIVIMNAALAERVVNARFRLDRIDDVISEVTNAFGAKSVVLPGGFVILS